MKTKFWTAFSSIESIESTFIQRLYNYFGDIEKAFNADFNELSQIDEMNIRRVNTFLRERDKVNPDKALEKVLERGIKILTLEDEKYPYMLKQIENPPIVLYVKGDLERCNLDRTLAVVGSRRASSNGKDVLQKIISGFYGSDICIVSGLALGIDTCAHRSALDNNLMTIGVIASGFDFTYPSENRDLYRQIETKYGAVLSEYYPTFEPLKFRFPQRNRIVTGLSYGTLVVEAAIRSGALISANLTLAQGRELMCVPGLVSNPNTEGIYKLLKQGAAMVTNSEDILNALNWELKVQPKNDDNSKSEVELCEEEIKILYSVEIEPKNFDEIQIETNFDTNFLLTCLTTLELKGIIKQIDGDRYLKNQ